MTLALPVVSNAVSESNFEATPSLTPGTLITASATPHTKGSWVSLIDPVDFDSFGIWLHISGTTTAATRTDGLLDIGIGPSGGGSEQVIVSNLVCGWRGLASTASCMNGMRLFLPIFIPKGVRVSARNQALIVSDSVRVSIVLAGGRGGLGMPICVGMDDYGIDTANSIGTSHTPGTTGAESAFANIGSTLSKNYKGVLIIPQGTLADTTMINQAYHWEVGYGSVTLAEWFYETGTSEIVCGPFPMAPFMCALPLGTQMQVRAESAAAAEAQDVGVYCLY
jgi:hypothetical protein